MSLPALSAFDLILAALSAAAQGAEAIAAFLEAKRQTGELTAEQAADLDRHAAALFASGAWQKRND
jgi:hypothetical protein